MDTIQREIAKLSGDAAINVKIRQEVGKKKNNTAAVSVKAKINNRPVVLHLSFTLNDGLWTVDEKVGFNREIDFIPYIGAVD